MSTVVPNVFNRHDLRRRLAVLAILTLTLVSASLDRRNVVYGRDTGETRRVENSTTPPTPEEMVRDMLSHD